MKYVWGITKQDILNEAKERGITLTKEQLDKIIDKIEWAFCDWTDGLNALIKTVVEK